MYNPIFAKSFNRYERRRFGFCAIFLCLIVAFSISSTFKPCLNRLSLFGHYAANLELHSMNAVQDMLMIDDKVENYDPTVDINAAEDFQLPTYGAENMLQVNHTSLNISQPIATEPKEAEPICRVSKASGDYCEIEGDITIQPNSSTIFVQTTSNQTNSWTIKPYPRKGIARVKNWTINLVQVQNQHIINIPKCTQNHTNPAILFSVGGFSGNYFHDFADILFPLYSSTLHFQREIHFLASDYKSWWINKFRQILEKLTKHRIIDIDREKQQVHCFNKIIVGLKFHKELLKTPSGPSMQNFRHLLRQTFSLERKKSIRLRKSKTRAFIKPRLMIISRKRTRILTNEDDLITLAENLGYEVVLAEAGVSSNVSRFAQTVNSCDVLIGVHGAGLTNMLFLPDNAVVIQMVPFGEIDEFARLDFGNPSRGMNLRYLEYKMSVKESSLSKEYPVDHPVLKDPKSYRRKGWGAIWSIYLEKQNVTVDLQRLKGTLIKALKLLHH